MSYHFVLSLETFSPFGTGAAFDRTKIRAIGGMDVGMSIE
jgi:hypothetical protein